MRTDDEHDRPPRPETDERQAPEGVPTGSDNARGRRDAANRPAPTWLQAARARLASDAYKFQRRNWGGSSDTPNLHGMTITVDEHAKDHAAPYRASFGGGRTAYFSDPAAARGAVEREFVEREDAARRERLAANPFADVDPAALLRALRSL